MSRIEGCEIGETRNSRNFLNLTHSRGFARVENPLLSFLLYPASYIIWSKFESRVSRIPISVFEASASAINDDHRRHYVAGGHPGLRAPRGVARGGRLYRAGAAHQRHARPLRRDGRVLQLLSGRLRVPKQVLRRIRALQGGRQPVHGLGPAAQYQQPLPQRRRHVPGHPLLHPLQVEHFRRHGQQYGIRRHSE